MPCSPRNPLDFNALKSPFLGFEGYMEGTELDLDLDEQKGTRKQLDFHHKHH